VRRSGVQATGQYVKLKCRHALKRLYQGNEIEKTRKEHVFAPPPSSTQPNIRQLSPAPPHLPGTPRIQATTSPLPPHPSNPNEPPIHLRPCPVILRQHIPTQQQNSPSQPSPRTCQHHITSHHTNSTPNGTKPLNFQQQPSPICTPSEPANPEPRQNPQRDRQTARPRTARSRLTKKRRKGEQEKRPRRS
jgi:hypothetical protein